MIGYVKKLIFLVTYLAYLRIDIFGVKIVKLTPKTFILYKLLGIKIAITTQYITNYKKEN